MNPKDKAKIVSRNESPSLFSFQFGRRQALGFPQDFSLTDCVQRYLLANKERLKMNGLVSAGFAF